MGLGDFWLQSNNGKKMSLQNLKELKKNDLKGNPKMIKLFDFFNTNKSNDSEEILDKEELTSLFNTMQNAAKSTIGKETSIFETEEAEEFINNNNTLSEAKIQVADLFEFLSKLIKPDNELQNSSPNLPSNVSPTDEQAQEEVIRILSDNAEEAIELLKEQNNGVVGGLYDKYKEWRDDDLSLSNVEEAVVLQQEGVYNLQKAKDGTLSKKEYFLQNREHLKTMMKRRMFRKDENTGLDFLDRNRGKMTKKEFEKLMDDYINMKIDSIADLEAYKSIQKGLLALSDSEIEQRFINIKNEAEKVDKYSYDPMQESKSKIDYGKCIPEEYNTTEPMTFEEVFKFERNQEYSKEKVKEYMVLQEASMAFNIYNTDTGQWEGNSHKQHIAKFGIDISKTDNECIEQIDTKQKSNYNSAFGNDYALDLVQSMQQDNKDFRDTIDEITDGTQIAGLGCTVVGGILCFTPAAAVGAGLITLGNSLSIGGLAAENAVGYTEALTRQNINPEEIEELNNSLLMDASGFLIGAAAGKVGMKAFNKLIDVKLAEVLKTQITQGNRMEALKQVFTNPEHLKKFTIAAGVKLSADFLISFTGDWVMSEALGTDDDWKSLLQSNLIGLAAGTSGDIKDIAHISIKGDKYRTLKQKEMESRLTAKEAEELATLRNDPDIIREYQNGDAEVKAFQQSAEKSSIQHDKKVQLPISKLLSLPEIQNLLGMEVEVTYTSGKKARLTIKEKLKKLSKQNPDLTKCINDIVRMAKKVKDGQRIQNNNLIGIRNKFCSTKLNDQLYDIECTLGSVKDKKILEFVQNELADIKANVDKTKDASERLTNVQLAIDAYNVAEGHYTYIGNKNNAFEYPEYREYLDFLDNDNNVYSEKLHSYPTFKEKYIKDDMHTFLPDKLEFLAEYRTKSAELQKNIRYTRLIEFCYKNPDSELSTHLYKEYYLKQAEVPKKIQKMCLNISEKYNTKIFLPKECKNLEQAIKYVEQELALYNEAMKGSTDRLRHVIDFSELKENFQHKRSGKDGSGGYVRKAIADNVVNIPGMDIEVIQNALRHELMHTFDTKFGVSMDDIEITEVAFPQKDENGNIIDIKWCKSSKYDDEFRKAGITDPELISYGYTDSRELVAVAAEGDMSEYSEEFEQVLISKGMPKWAFKLKPNPLNVNYL